MTGPRKFFSQREAVQMNGLLEEIINVMDSSAPTDLSSAELYLTRWQEWEHRVRDYLHRPKQDSVVRY